MALGRNPWPLLVPCHRFLGAKGKLTGYSGPGGIATKERLLALELAELPIAYAPL
jgi:methylated-DNA-[protein]-cysteine S-methyltransferase